MIARAIENLFFTAAVSGTHRALTEMGVIHPDATGTPAQQVRLAIAGPAETAAVANAPPAEPERPVRGRRGGQQG